MFLRLEPGKENQLFVLVLLGSGVFEAKSLFVCCSFAPNSFDICIEICCIQSHSSVGTWNIIVVISKIRFLKVGEFLLIASWAVFPHPHPPRLTLCIGFLPEEPYMQYWFLPEESYMQYWFLTSVCFICSATLLWPKEAYLMIMSLSCLLDTTSQWWSFQQRWWKRWRSIRLHWESFLRVEGNDVFYLREIIRAITSSYR